MSGRVAVQGLVVPVAYELGLQCPVGLEHILLAGLDKFWPELPRTALAREAFLRGLADRFEESAFEKESKR